MIKRTSIPSAPSEFRAALELVSRVEEGQAPPQALMQYLTSSVAALMAAFHIGLPQEAAKEFSADTRRNLEAMLTTHRPSGHDAVDEDISSRPEQHLPGRVHWSELFWRRSLGGVAAVVLVGLAIGLFFVGGDTWQRYQTSVGQQLPLTLADGTRVTLNTSTELEVKLGERTREVRLIRGEARFSVISMPDRPFIVMAGNIRVRTIGTEFGVYRASARTYVSVLKGKIALALGDAAEGGGSEIYLQKGQGVRVGSDGAVTRMSASELSNAESWKMRKFSNAALGSIAEEFNRYNVSKIYVQGLAAENRFSGVFPSTSPDTLVALLDADPAYEVIKEGGNTTIRLKSK